MPGEVRPRTWKYPANDGFYGDYEVITVPPGTMVDRFGPEYGMLFHPCLRIPPSTGCLPAQLNRYGRHADN